MHSFKTILTCLCLTATALAQELLPPKQSTEVKFELVATWAEDGGTPASFQWYRGTKTKPLAVKLTTPDATERTLTLRPPMVAGIYVCVMSNEAGSAQCKPTQVSITKVVTAVDAQVTFKQP